jgi:hypothetical protein
MVVEADVYFGGGDSNKQDKIRLEKDYFLEL